jgi:succinate dehydrogenase / fumarate reductase, cytochrome b subunit
MNIPMSFYSTSVGKKVVMAFTGLIMFGFVVVHLLGNLQLYAGPEKLNAYARFLESLGVGLWIARLTLFVAAALHITAALQLALQNWHSRPVSYLRYTPKESTFSSRNMIWAGLMLGSFIGYHLFHLTFGFAHPSFQPGNVYANVVVGFSFWPVAICYVLAMIFLGLHLYHGLYSMFQSLGLNHPKYNPWRRTFATAATVILCAGNISLPLAVLTGFIY